jgi:MFS family permease
MTTLPRGSTRSVAALLVSVFCASTAAMAGVTALGKQLYDLTDSELDLGFLGLAEFAPAALLVLVTGAVADRFDRRRVAALAALGEAAAALALAAYAASDGTSAAPIFGLVLLFGVARAFIAPASRAMPADIVTAERLPWLVARHSGTWQLAIIVGPVLGGVLYAVDPALPYLAMAVLLVVAAASALVIEVAPRPAAVATPKEAKAGVHDALEGLRFIRQQPVLLGAIALDLFAVLFGGAVALLPAIAEDRLGVGAVGLGWLRAAGGIGAAVVTAVLAIRPLSHRVGRTLLTVVATFGVFTIVLGVTRSYAVAFVALAVLSGADAVSVFIRATLVPLATPPEMRGRVLAVENVFIGASNELGAFESGVAGHVLGAPGAIVLGGAATVMIAGTWWRLFPALRDLDRFPSVVSDPLPGHAGPPAGSGLPGELEKADDPSAMRSVRRE